MTAKPAFTPLVALLAMTVAACALIASECEHDVDFPPFVQEICTDNVDNDEDGLADCDDSDCSGTCAVQLVIFPPSTTTADSLLISGTHENAASINLAVTPSGIADAGTISGNSWSSMIRNLNLSGTHTITATATSADGLKDTVIMTFEKRN